MEFITSAGHFRRLKAKPDKQSSYPFEHDAQIVLVILPDILHPVGAQ
jgi:hypothetical protein